MIEPEPLVFAGICDLSGHFRGKAFPACETPVRLAKGVGYTGTNIMMTAFGPALDTPYGTEGDLALVPDPSTAVDVAVAEGGAARFYLCDVVTAEGEPWACCPRTFLRRGLERLRAETGLELVAAFEQEFVLPAAAAAGGTTYGYDSFRRRRVFGETLTAALRAAGLAPDSFLPEYGPGQFEVTVAPTAGVRAADEAVILRELVRGVALRMGEPVTLSPVVALDQIGSGTHIHFSLRDAAGAPVLYDPAAPWGLGDVGAAFVAGIVAHLPDMVALTAPSIASYYRLRPNRWAPTWSNLAVRDRGAAVRVCPIFGRAEEAAASQFNVEFRVTDATASPYMALGALVHAGLDGIRAGLRLPAPFAHGFAAASDAEKRAAGWRPLPQSLGEAVDALAASPAVTGWLGAELAEAYVRLRRSELAFTEGEDEAAIVARYARAY